MNEKALSELTPHISVFGKAWPQNENMGRDPEFHSCTARRDNSDPRPPELFGDAARIGERADYSSQRGCPCSASPLTPVPYALPGCLSRITYLADIFSHTKLSPWRKSKRKNTCHVANRIANRNPSAKSCQAPLVQSSTQSKPHAQSAHATRVAASQLSQLLTASVQTI